MAETAVTLRFTQRIGFLKIDCLSLDYKHLRHSLTFEYGEWSRLAAFEYHADALTKICVHYPCVNVSVKPVFRHIEFSGKAF